jgi:hypothetical protein
MEILDWLNVVSAYLRLSVLRRQQIEAVFFLFLGAMGIIGEWVTAVIRYIGIETTDQWFASLVNP